MHTEAMNVRIDEDLLRAVKQRCLNDNVTLREFTERLFARELGLDRGNVIYAKPHKTLLTINKDMKGLGL